MAGNIYEGELLLQLAVDRSQLDKIEKELVRRFGSISKALSGALQVGGKGGRKGGMAGAVADDVDKARKRMEAQVKAIQRQFEELMNYTDVVGMKLGDFAEFLTETGRPAERFAKSLLKVTDAAAAAGVKFGYDRDELERLRASLTITNAVIEDSTRKRRDLERMQRDIRVVQDRIVGLQRLVGATGQKDMIEKIMGDPKMLERYGRNLLRVNERLRALGQTALLSTKEAEQLRLSIAKTTGDTLPKLIKKVGMWLAATGAVFALINAFRQLFTTIGQVDSATADLQKVMNSSADQQKEMAILLREARKAAMDYGASVVDVMHIQRDWYRQYQDANKVVELTKVSLLAMNIAELSVEDSTRLLTSTMRQFSIETSDAIDILDVWNALSNKAGVATKDVAEATVRAGAAFRGAGGSLQQLAGLAATAIKATGRSGQQVGTLLKTLSAYYVRPETVKAVKEITGISIVRQKGELMDFMDFMGRLAAQWDSLTDAQKASVSMAIAGSRRYSGLQAILRQWGQALNDITTAYDSVGSAERENATFMRHQERQVTRLKAALQSLAISFSAATGLGKEIIVGAKSLADFTSKASSARANTIRLTVAVGAASVTLLGLLRILPSLAAAWEALTTAVAASGAVVGGISALLSPITLVIGALSVAVGIGTKKWLDHAAALEDVEMTLDQLRTKEQLAHDHAMSEIGITQTRAEKLQYYADSIERLQKIKNRSEKQEKELLKLQTDARSLLELVNEKPLPERINLIHELNRALGIQLGLEDELLKRERLRLKAAEDRGKAAKSELAEVDARLKSISQKLAKAKPEVSYSMMVGAGPLPMVSYAKIDTLKKQRADLLKRRKYLQKLVQEGEIAKKEREQTFTKPELPPPEEEVVKARKAGGGARASRDIIKLLRWKPTADELARIRKQAQEITVKSGEKGALARILYPIASGVWERVVVEKVTNEALSTAISMVYKERREIEQKQAKLEAERKRAEEDWMQFSNKTLETFAERSNRMLPGEAFDRSIQSIISPLGPEPKKTLDNMIKEAEQDRAEAERRIHEEFSKSRKWWYDFQQKILEEEQKTGRRLTVDVGNKQVPVVDLIEQTFAELDRREEASIAKAVAASRARIQAMRLEWQVKQWKKVGGGIFGGIAKWLKGFRFPVTEGEKAFGAMVGFGAKAFGRYQEVKKATEPVIRAYKKMQSDLLEMRETDMQTRMRLLDEEVAKFREAKADEYWVTKYYEAAKLKILLDAQEKVRKENYRTFKKIEGNIADAMANSLANASNFADGMKRILRSIVLETIRQQIVQSPVVQWLGGVISRGQMKKVPQKVPGKGVTALAYASPLAFALAAASLAKSRGKQPDDLTARRVPEMLAKDIPGSIPAYNRQKNAMNVRIVEDPALAARRSGGRGQTVDPRTGKPIPRKLPFRDVIGGSAGATVSQLAGAYGIYQGGDAISGALMGYALTGGPIGLVGGALLGLFGSRRRKKQAAALRAQQEAERKRQEALARRVMAPFDVAFQGVQYLPDSALFGGRGNTISGRTGTVSNVTTISVGEVNVHTTGDAREAGRQFVSGMQEEAIARGMRFSASAGMSRSALPSAF